MLSQTSHIAIATALALLVPTALLGIWVIKRGWASAIARLRSLSGWQRIAAVLLGAWLVGYGGSKPSPPDLERFWEIITVRPDGEITDLRGMVVSGAIASALDAWQQEAWRIAAAMSNLVAASSQQCAGLTNQLHQASYTPAYIALDLPRATPAASNHNISAAFERIEHTTSNLTAWVWFSELPSTNVAVHLEYSIAPDAWHTLQPLSSSYPATELVEGAECIRYEYAIPASIAGVPLRPQYEIEFGGYAPGAWLSVPADGVVVSVGETDHLPYTGWDTYGSGPDALQVRYIGGIAVEAIQYGHNYKGTPTL